MKVTCISDLHGYYPSNLSGGDLLIIAGDLTARDEFLDYHVFCGWLEEQKYTKKILIAGNHDMKLQDNLDFEFPDLGIEYLEDSGTEFMGFKIWGSPWSLWFDDINPKCSAFTGDELELNEKWEMIPDDVNILITHTPPNGILDDIGYEQYVGSNTLRFHVMNRIKPRIHCFGHIHEWGGRIVDCATTKFINASHVNEQYKPVNKWIDLEL